MKKPGFSRASVSFGAILTCAVLLSGMNCQSFARRADGKMAEVVILDTAGNGIQLQGPDTGPQLQFPAARVRIGWTVAKSDDAFIVVEMQQNARIDDLTELLGWQGPPNGFDFLRAMDGTSEEEAARGFGPRRRSPDGIIDAADAVFARLVLWNDFDADGQSIEAELRSVRHAGYDAFRLVGKRSGRSIAGNRVVESAVARRTAEGRQLETELHVVRLAVK